MLAIDDLPAPDLSVDDMIERLLRVVVVAGLRKAGAQQSRQRAQVRARDKLRITALHLRQGARVQNPVRLAAQAVGQTAGNLVLRLGLLYPRECGRREVSKGRISVDRHQEISLRQNRS